MYHDQGSKRLTAAQPLIYAYVFQGINDPIVGVPCVPGQEKSLNKDWSFLRQLSIQNQGYVYVPACH